MAQLPDAPRRQFTAQEVGRMVEAGILGEDEPVELIGGELVIVSPQGPFHAETVSLFVRALTLAYIDVAHVRSRAPIDAGPTDRPEPDVCVVRGGVRHYSGRHPRGDELLLAVEIAWTSQEIDHRKADLYARVGVPVYWLVDVRARRIEIHAEPSSGRYGVVTLLGEERVVRPPGLDVGWTLADLLPASA